MLIALQKSVGNIHFHFRYMPVIQLQLLTDGHRRKGTFVMVLHEGITGTVPSQQINPQNFWKPSDYNWHNTYTPHRLKDPISGWNTSATWKEAKLNFVDFLREAVYPFPLVITPLFPLLFLSLARQKYSPNTKSFIKTEYDYIVVGAGGAGSVVASRLSEIKCVSVLLLEAGKPPPIVSEIPSLSGTLVGGPFDWQIKTVPQKHTAYGIKNNEVPMPRGKAIGGTTIMNSMLYVRGNRKDYDNWEAQGARGWGWRDVFPYFLKAENNTDWDIVNNGYHNTHGPMTVGRFPTDSVFKDVSREVAACLGYPYLDVNGPTQIELYNLEDSLHKFCTFPGFADFQGNIRHGQRCSSAKAYLVPAEDRQNLDIVAEAFVTKILISERKAVGVQFDYKGHKYNVRCRREVIVSAGNLNTPKLLMLSGIGPRKILEHFDIPVLADLPVGQNLHDHPTTLLNFVVRRDIPPYLNQQLSPVNQLKYITNRFGALANAQGIFSLAFLPYNHTRDLQEVPDLQIYFLEGIAPITLTRFQLKPWTFFRLYGRYLLSTTLWCEAQLLRPRSRGYVSIRSKNPYDPPVVDPKFLSHPEDIKVLVKGMKFCLEFARSPPMQKFLTRPFKTVIPGCERHIFDETEYLTCYARHYMLSLNHDAGTARMGDPFDPRTVVDPELRVKTIRGLRVVDASIMPTAPSGTPWSPVVMIAEKASDMIKESIHCF